MLAVKHDEIAAESIGIAPVKYKLLAFVLSAAFAGAVGVFYASYVSFISPDTFVYTDSVTILAMVVLGGMASLPGAVLGALVLSAVPEILRAINDYRPIWRPDRGGSRIPAPYRPGDPLPDRPQRRRQDHLLQPAHRHVHAGRGLHHLHGPGHLQGQAP